MTAFLPLPCKTLVSSVMFQLSGATHVPDISLLPLSLLFYVLAKSVELVEGLGPCHGIESPRFPFLPPF